ncbi:restriction endonuclease [bacterium]|nr:restriction endonuclease [bacterium]
MENTLYYGDNLEILRNHIADNSVDLIYLDPPFNSKADYNILFKEPTGEPSKAQITAFEDTWHWTIEAERTYQEIIRTAPASVVEMMRAFRQFVGLNDVMAYLTMMCIRLIELKRVLKDTGSIYLHCDPTASHYLKILMDTVFGKKNFRNEIIWHYKTGGVSKRWFGRKHDIIFFYARKGDSDYVFNLHKEKSYMMHKYGFKKSDFQEDDLGQYSMTYLKDVFIIPAIGSADKQRLGYPTQKPESLLERIVKASSKEGDAVLDPFCGCGTSIAVAQGLNRNWIGIDITHLAINLIKWRLKNTFELEPKRDYDVIGEPEDLAGAKELASQDRFQFQWWALSMIDARPYGDKKKGADTGIDGFIYFMDRKNEYKKVIVQVKSGKTQVGDIRDLCHVIDREDAVIGLFVTLENPTQPMIEEAAAKGFYKSNITKKDYPKIQILTIDNIFKGKKPGLPQQFCISPYEKAERVVPKKQNEMFDN